MVARVIEISDVADPRLAPYADLRSGRRNRDHAGSFIVEGRWCLDRLVDSPHAILSVVGERSKTHDIAAGLPESTNVYSLPPEQIRQLVGFDFHRGVLACGARPRYQSIDQLCFEPPSPAMVLAVLGVSEKENLGSMLRTAAALGIQQILIGPRTVDPFSRRAIRVSMASVFYQTLYQLDRPQIQLMELQERMNVRTIVTTLDPHATPLDQFVADDRNCILVVGNEAEGVDRLIQQTATDRVTIPMQLGTDSLNVSVAAAIFMYQLRGG